MGIQDVLLFLPIAIGAYRGFKKGFFREVFSMHVSYVAVLFSLKFLDKAKVWVSHYIPNMHKGLLTYLSFFMLLTSIILIFIGLRKLLQPFFQITILGSIDSFLGTIMGMLQWAMFMSCLIWLIGDFFQVQIPAAYIHNSELYQIIQPMFPGLLAFMRDFWLLLYQTVPQ